ncbi:apolipoprotein N-acyltransferase [Actimicrobium sp. CCI2.3]|uniref:apolipoprotein N-acyltransferase n=1 Tax=Actimicrobium sp. CCI2.3 TaxID=3048616 RepID=UPI002AB47516|nr:apolipoprotein N-acyltransferase [Actimicrobium sp. CCI2.3]MDY7573777.1 apolipoprotein N-acyltransferase [Actimicrobium sp. CCI2.3]MEB0022388.1 apolipoprotein N-acyltransferase [Actimicrobium sp. CCI2.3]
MPLNKPGRWPQRFGPLLAFAAGSGNVLAFAPYGLWPLQILSLCVLCWLLLGSERVRHSALLGWMYGFGWLLFGTCWLYISLHDYGALPAVITVIAVAGLALFLAGLMAAATGMAAAMRVRWRCSPAVFLLLVVPALFMLAEWTRAWIFTGFPWLSSGYAHNAGPLAGYAPLVGVYGIGLIAAVITGALVLLPQHRRLGWLAALLFIVGALLQQVSWTTPQGQPISVRLLQANVPQEMKFNPERVPDTLIQYHAMITAAPADLIVTPETALPLLLGQLPEDYLPRLAGFAQSTGSQLLVGVPVNDSPLHYTNSVIGIGGKQPYRYDKHHLVPFGEFIPFGFRWFTDLMHIPLGDFSRGDVQQTPLAVQDQWVLPNICYEDLFGEEIAAQLNGRAAHTTVLLNVSNIAWFGNSIALPQHLQISQMRARETGRPMLRATNTGATAVIDQRGRVVSQLTPLSTGVLGASVQGYTGKTPYILMGNWLALAIAGIMLLAACLLRKSQPT